MTGGSSPRLELTAAGARFAFRRCPPGSFLMGSALSEPGREPAETRRRARLTREFWILETQTTQRMWRAVMGSNPSEQNGARLPAEHVSWFDASDFAAVLTGSTTKSEFSSLPNRAVVDKLTDITALVYKE